MIPAISIINHMKQSGSKFPAKHLANTIQYIMNPEKTQNSCLIGAVNCIPEYALKQMLQTKCQFAKPDQRQGYHLVISFVEGEVTPEQAFEIVGKFTNEYLGKEYEAVYSVHDNTKHIHGHVVFNSVSFLHGRKFHYVKGDWERYIQPIVNRLCEEYELSTINLGTEYRDKEKVWDRSKNGTFVWNNMITMDVEDALSFATNYENFLSLMQLKGYEIKQGKHISVKPQSMKRFRRLDTINEEYTKDFLEERILQGDVLNYQPKISNPSPKILYGRGNFKSIKRVKLLPFQRKYFAKLYRTGQLRKRPYSEVWKYKDDIKKFNQLQEQYLYISRMHIKSNKDLQNRQLYLEEKEKELKDERRKFYRKRYPYKEMLSHLKQMETVLREKELYEKGDIEFKSEYEIFNESKQQINSYGITLEQAVTIKNSFEAELLEINQKKRELYKEQKLCKQIEECTYLNIERQERNKDIIVIPSRKLTRT